MKHVSLTSLSALAIAFVVSSCSLSSMIKKAQDQKLTVTPSPLELAGDSVKFSLNAVLPAGLLRKNKLYTLKPTYKYGDQKVELTEFVFKAEDYPKSKKEVVKASKVYAFPYIDPTMSKGSLVVQGAATNINGKGKKTKEFEIAQGLLTTARLVDYNFTPILVDLGYTPADEIEPARLNFYFEQGTAVLRASEIKSIRGQYLDNFIASKNLTNTVTVTGSHSPEGREAKNVSLSEDRAIAIEKYYRSKLEAFALAANPKGKKAQKGKKGAATPSASAGIQFVTKSLIEDWRPFVDTLNAYTGFTDAEKAEILAIVNSTEGTFPERELKLQALATYPKLFVEVYPKLRFAQTEILAKKVKKSEAEIVLLAKEAIQGNAESLKKLDEKELAFAASLSRDLDEREKIYRASIRKNDLWESQNNLGAILLNKACKAEGEDRVKYAKEAITSLLIAINKKDNGYSQANLALAKALSGDLGGATGNLENAGQTAEGLKVAPLVNALRGSIAVRDGKYPIAIKNLTAADNSGAASLDLALAYLMTKDYGNAKAAIAKAQQAEPSAAIYDYVAAIIATRQKAVAPASAELKKAFAKKPGLKQLALKDAEFNTIAGNDSFVNALK